MNELVIKNIKYISDNDTYMAQCIVVTGKVLPGTTWYLKYNPHLKITLNKQVENVEDTEIYLVDWLMAKPGFDLSIFNKPTSWLNK